MAVVKDRIRVALADRGYDILLGKGILHECGKYLCELSIEHVFIISDDLVADVYLQELITVLSASHIQHEHMVLPHGEHIKSFTVLQKIVDAVLAIRPDRKLTILALGGGVIGDIAGFVASIILRGIRFVQIPTTLLAQVDSSVGGKTGINHHYGKNLIGSFYQPSLVIADSMVLQSLPIRQFRAGYAEVVKYALINDAPFFDWLEEHIDEVMAYDHDALAYIVAKSCRAKADIVVRDERESGCRALLNLGHTLGHALEAETQYSSTLLHGEAVAIGSVFAFFFSWKLGLCSDAELEKVKTHLLRAGLPISPLAIRSQWQIDDLVSKMFWDKKTIGKQLVFILARKIGSCFIEKQVDHTQLTECLHEFIS